MKNTIMTFQKEREEKTGRENMKRNSIEKRKIFVMRNGDMSQMFIFLMAIIVVGATIFIGMKLIGGLAGTACTANDATFQRQMAETLDRYSTFGSFDTVKLDAGCDAAAVCFVDARSLGKAAFTSEDDVIEMSVRENVQSNIFLTSEEKPTVPAGFEPRIILTKPDLAALNEPLCINATSGGFRFTVEGFGRYVKISQPGQ